MKLFRSIATVGGFTMASRFFGFIRTILTASYLGAGLISDALEIAIKFPSFLRRLFAEGAFNAAFIPFFAGNLAEFGEASAKSLAEEILAFLIFFLLILVILVEIFMGDLMPIVVPGFIKTPERLHYAIEFTRITFPFIFFISLTALYSGILNSFDRFAAVASSPMAGNVAIIAIVLSQATSFPTPGHAFAVSILICGIVQCMWVWLPALKLNMALKIIYPRFTPQVKNFLIRFGPAAASSGVVQVNILIGMVIASYLPAGGVSYIAYADRLNQLPLSVIGTAIGTALLPLLSRQIRSGHHEKALHSQNEALEFAMILTLPATVGLIALAHPMVTVLFERNAFNALASLATSHALMAFAAGLPAYIMIKIFSACFFAHQNTHTPLKAAAIAVVVDIGLSILFIRPFQHVGIGLATAIAAWVNAILLGYLLWKKGYFIIDERLKKIIPKYILVTLFTFLYLKFSVVIFKFWELETAFLKTAILCFIILSGIAFFFLLAKLLGAINFKELKLKFQGT
jgi:putative peptidoglycan lipid II flippase